MKRVKKLMERKFTHPLLDDVGDERKRRKVNGGEWWMTKETLLEERKREEIEVMMTEKEIER